MDRKDDKHPYSMDFSAYAPLSANETMKQAQKLQKTSQIKATKIVKQGHNQGIGTLVGGIPSLHGASQRCDSIKAAATYLMKEFPSTIRKKKLTAVTKMCQTARLPKSNTVYRVELGIIVTIRDALSRLLLVVCYHCQCKGFSI